MSSSWRKEKESVEKVERRIVEKDRWAQDANKISIVLLIFVFKV